MTTTLSNIHPSPLRGAMPTAPRWLAALGAAICCGCSLADGGPMTDEAGLEASIGEAASACRYPARRGPRLLEHHPRLYVPDGSPAARQAEIYRAAGQSEEAALMDALAAQPQVVYLAGGTPEEVRARVEATVAAARAQRQLPVFAAYNLPGRDCSQYSGGGANTEGEYRAWIDALARGIGAERAVVLVEPDGVALPPTEPWCGEAGGGFSGAPEDLSRFDERFRELRYAVRRLGGLPRVDVYLDAGHSAWHPLNDYDAYYGEPRLQFGVVNRLLLAGVGEAAGFFLNPSNNRTTESLLTYGERVAKCLALLERDPNYALPDGYQPSIVYDDAGRFASPCPSDAELDAMALTPDLRRRMPHFVIDTSRNGQGPWELGDPASTGDDAAGFAALYGVETTDPQIWCNAPGRGLGPRPTTRTGHPLVDAFLWIKVPGESDGECGRNLIAPDPSWPSGWDVAWGQVDPPAGQWFEAQALELAHLAAPPLAR